MYTDSFAVNGSLCTPATALRVEFDDALDGVDELLQLFAQAGRRGGDTHPPPPSQSVFEPVVEHIGDAHQIHVHSAGTLTLDAQILTKRLSRDDAQQACFLLGLSNRRFTWLLPVVDGSLRHHPTLAPGGRDQGHFDPLLADPIGNHRRLLVYAGHPSPCRT